MASGGDETPAEVGGPGDPASTSRTPRTGGGRPVCKSNEWLYDTWYYATGRVNNGVKERQCKGKPPELWAHTEHCQGLRGTEQERDDAKSKARELLAERGASASTSDAKRKRDKSGQRTASACLADRPLSNAQRREADSLLVRATVSAALPWTWCENAEVQQFFQWLRPGFQLSSWRGLITTLGEEFSAAVARNNARIKQEDVGVTMGVHGSMESIIDINVVLGSSRVSILWHSEDTSAATHTAEQVAEFLMAQIRQLEGRIEDRGPEKRVAMLCTDNAPNMRKARELVVRTPGFTHIAECSCVLRALALGMAAIIRQPEVQAVVTDVLKVVTLVRASHQSKAALRGLRTMNKAYLTSVHECLSSFVPTKHAIQSMLLLDGRFLGGATEERDGDGQQLLTPDGVTRIRALVAKDLFWTQVAEIAELLQPFVEVTTMVQSNRTTLADVQRYWLYLAQSLEWRLINELSTLTAECRNDIAVNFNMRLLEMSSKLGQVALFLDPYYRGLVLADAEAMLEIRITAGMYWASRGHSQAEVLALSSEMQAYEAYAAPYNQALDNQPGFKSVMGYWRALSQPSPQLSGLALLLFGMCPHAAGAERDLCLFGDARLGACDRPRPANAHKAAVIQRDTEAAYPPAEERQQKRARPIMDQGADTWGSAAEDDVDDTDFDDDDAIGMTEAELAAGVVTMNRLLDEVAHGHATTTDDVSAVVVTAFAGLKTIRTEAEPLEVQTAEPAVVTPPAELSQGAAGFDGEALLTAFQQMPEAQRALLLSSLMQRMQQPVPPSEQQPVAQEGSFAQMLKGDP